MLDNLKDRIDQNREELEIYPFDSENGWKDLSKKVAPKRKSHVWRIAGIAACLALVAVGTLYRMTPATPTSEISEMEQYYNSEIDERIALVKSHLNDDRVLEDLEIMDQTFAELKADLKDNVDNEEVISAMMENYRLKLHILEEILNELEKERSESTL